MTSTQIIASRIDQIPENELIFASKLYAQTLCGEVTESAYYKTLERLCKAGKLCKMAVYFFCGCSGELRGTLCADLDTDARSAESDPTDGNGSGQS